MSVIWLCERIQSSSKLDTTILRKHEYMFHKIGEIDGSAKCDAEETGNPEHIVFGVLFNITDADKLELDREEGLEYRYTVKDVCV